MVTFYFPSGICPVLIPICICSQISMILPLYCFFYFTAPSYYILLFAHCVVLLLHVYCSPTSSIVLFGLMTTRLNQYYYIWYDSLILLKGRPTRFHQRCSIINIPIIIIISLPAHQDTEMTIIYGRWGLFDCPFCERHLMLCACFFFFSCQQFTFSDVHQPTFSKLFHMTWLQTMEL